MSRASEIVKWLTGFIGYAHYPRPDVVRPPTRLMKATNVWMSGTKGIAQRRGGVSLAKALDEPFYSLVSVPALSGDRMLSMVIVNSGSGFFTSAAGALAYWHTWTWNYGAFTHGVTLNRKAYLAQTADLPLVLVDTAIANMDLPAAPTAANTGVGAYAATLRYYRVQWYDGSSLELRGPISPALSFTPSGAGTGVVVTRPTPPVDHAATHWYLWASADGQTFYRLATTSIVTDTVTDTTAPASYSTVTGEVFADSLLATPVRYVGTAASDVPTVADTGAGAYAATLRYYRTRWVTLSGGVVVKRGEPSTSVSFTPSGGGTAARVSRTTNTLDAAYGVTHWELEVSLDNVNWYLLTTVVLATTTYDDSAATTTYSGGDVSDTIGTYLVPPSARSIAADRDRLLFAGGWEPGTFSRVWYTPVLGTLNVSDDERVPTDNYFDIEAHDDDEITAIIGPIGGAMLVFKHRSFFRLVRTGDATAPYDVVKVTEGLGCDGPNHLCLAPGPSGSEACYFKNNLGAYRYDVSDGLTRLTDDLYPPWTAGQASGYGLVAHRVVPYLRRGVVLFGEVAYTIATGGWAWQDWGRADANLQIIVRIAGTDIEQLILPSTGATAQGLYYANSALTLVDVDDLPFTAEVRTNRFSLVAPTVRWRPTRLRLWGAGDGMTCRTFTDTGNTPLTSLDFTLGTAEDADWSRLLAVGAVEWLGLSFQDGPEPAVWSLDAVEITGREQESIP